jgi:hypothetical protein
MPQGLGCCPIGSSPWGYGVPDVANSSTAAVLKKPDGTQGAVPLIVDGDFVLDAYGQKVGADATPMMVQHGLETVRNRNAVPNFGLDLTLSVYSADAQKRADTAVRLALKHLTDAKKISVMSVSLTRVAQSGVQLVTRWVDLANGSVNTALLPLGS